MNSMDTGRSGDVAGHEQGSTSGRCAESLLRSSEILLRDLSQGAAGLMRLAAEVRVQLDRAIPELDRLQTDKAMLLTENQELQRRRQELAAEMESERTAALADLSRIRASAEAGIEQLRQSKACLEAEIQELEERRARVTGQIESFLKDQLNLFRHMDAEARALEKEFQSRRPGAGEAS